MTYGGRPMVGNGTNCRIPLGRRVTLQACLCTQMRCTPSLFLSTYFSSWLLPKPPPAFRWMVAGNNMKSDVWKLVRRGTMPRL
eukprot:SAG31_NODE_1619_length_7729_cov_2.231193_3_plen_83_part_00